jgi:integrase
MSSKVIPFTKEKEKVWVRDEKDRFLVLHRPTGTWYVRAKKKGKKPLFKATGFTQKTKARTKALLLLAEWMGTKRPESFETILFGEFAEDFLVYLEKTKLRSRTKENARYYIRQLIQEMGHENIANINEGYFDEWLVDFKLKVNRGTFADYAKYLSKVLRHAHRKGIIARLPKFLNPDPKKETGRIYTKEEIRALLYVSDVTLELQIRLCLQSFMRLREMLHLTWDRVDLEDGIITLGADNVKTGSKTGEGRRFYVNEEIKALLKYRRQRVRGLYVFPARDTISRPQWSNKTAWRTAKRKAQIKGKSRWHDLRHTALTWALVEKKMNPLIVSKYAGVSVRTIEKVYLKIQPEHMMDVANCIEI